MIIKLQSILLPYARQREEKETAVLTKKDRVNADRMIMAMLFIMAIIAAIIFA